MSAAPAAHEPSPTRSAWRHVLAAAAFALAGAHVAVILAIDALVAADYEWAISGPPPFDAFGGGPYMLGLHVAFVLAILGLAGAGAALLTRKRWLLAAALPPAALGVLGGSWSLLLSDAL